MLEIYDVNEWIAFLGNGRVLFNAAKKKNVYSIQIHDHCLIVLIYNHIILFIKIFYFF